MATASWFMSLFFLSSLVVFTSSTTITIPLFHPTKHPSSSSDPWQTLSYLAATSLHRALHLKSPKTNLTLIKTPVFPRRYGGYSISLSFGTPPQTIKFVMDTGSSLPWFPCTSRYACSKCDFPGITDIPTFKPNLSSTAELVGCKNPKCAMVLGPDVLSTCQDSCDPNSQNCTQSCPPYLVQYGSGSTAGLLLLETLDFPEKTVPGFLVGCSIFSLQQPEGIAGFGRSPESLPSQLGAKKFTYCLVSHRFDDNPAVSSDLVLETGSGSGDAKTPGLSYTPFVRNLTSTFTDYYYVLLRKVIVGGKSVDIPYDFLLPGSNGKGGTIVDSGTTFTFMDRPVYELVVKEFEKQMTNFTVAQEVENRTGLRPCFNISGEQDILFPQLIFQFKGGAKMVLPPANYFSFLDLGVVCLTIVSDGVLGPALNTGPAIILGNYQQQNYLIEYDLENQRFGFKQQICSGA